MICFWRWWLCHKRQVLVWIYVVVLIVKPYQDIQNIIPKYEKRWDKQDVRVSLRQLLKGCFWRVSFQPGPYLTLVNVFPKRDHIK